MCFQRHHRTTRLKELPRTHIFIPRSSASPHPHRKHPAHQLVLHDTMAGDTRDTTSSEASSTKYETFTSPPPSANALPAGSGQNTAGSRVEPLSLKDAVKTVRWQDFSQVHMYPCVRESFLMGIAGAFGAGAFRAIFGGLSLFFISCRLLIAESNQYKETIN